MEARKCPKCKADFSSTLVPPSRKVKCRLPIVLNCGHGLCYDCVGPISIPRKHPNDQPHQDNVDTTIQVRCGVCSKQTRYSADDFDSIISLIHWYQLGMMHLDHLEMEIRADSIGFSAHSASKYNQQSSHKKQSDSVDHCKQQNDPKKSRLSECPEHQSSLELWCCTDDEKICCYCALFGEHKGHEVIKLSDKNLQSLEGLKQSVDLAKARLEQLNYSDKLLDCVMSNIQAFHQETVWQIRHHFIHLHGILQKKEHEIQNQVKYTVENDIKKVDEMKNLISAGRENIAATIEKGIAAIQDCKSFDVEHLLSELNCTEKMGTLLVTSDGILQKDNVSNLQNNLNVDVDTDVLHQLEELCHNSIAVKVYGEIPSLKRLEDLTPEDQDLWRSLLQPSMKANIKPAAFAVPPKLSVASKMLSQANTSPKAATTNTPVGYSLNTVPVVGTSSKSTTVNEPLVLGTAAPRCFHVDSEGRKYGKGSKFVGSITHVDSLQQFYVQIHGENLTLLQSLQNDLQKEYCVPVPGPFIPKRGEICAAKCLQDQLWHRALVEETGPPRLLVYFLDDGRRELTTINNLRPLHPKFTIIPAQAVCCSLNRLGPPAGYESFPESSIKEFSMLTTNKPLWIEVEYILHGSVGCIENKEFTFKVVLFEHGKELVESFNSTLVRMKLATGLTPKGHWKQRFSKKRLLSPDGPVEAPPPLQAVVPLSLQVTEDNKSKKRIILTHFETPGSFYVQTVNAQKTFETLARDLKKHFELEIFTIDNRRCGVQLGGLYAFQKNHVWHRCQVELSNGNQSEIRLIDTGVKLTVLSDILRPLGPEWSSISALATRCGLWGVKPAGDPKKWTRLSCEKFTEVVTKATSLFIEIYSRELDIQYVRLYYDYIKAGGALECDVLLSACLNDQFLDEGIALRQLMIVNNMESLEEWLPCRALTTKQFEAVPVWIDTAGMIYLHVEGTTTDLHIISSLLEFYFSNSVAKPEDLNWSAGEPCIVRYASDQNWYRGQVISADNGKQIASVFFVDFGNEEDRVLYTDMRKTLLGREYRVQACRCRLANLELPDQEMWKPDELQPLQRAVIDKRCQVTVEEFSIIPKVSLKVLDQTEDLNDIIQSMKEVRQSEDQDKLEEMPSDSDLDIPIDFTCSDNVYRPLTFPMKPVPVNLLGVQPEAMVMIQPRIELNNDGFDIPPEWNEQASSYLVIQASLQDLAASLPTVAVNDHALGSPCAARNPTDQVWYRGIFKGYLEDQLNTIHVELVDIYRTVFVDCHEVRELPCELRNLPRNSALLRLVDSDLSCIPVETVEHVRTFQNSGNLWAEIQKLGGIDGVKLFQKNEDGELINLLNLVPDIPEIELFC